MYAGILGYISYMEYTGRPEEKPGKKNKKAESNIQETLSRWYFVLIIMIFSITSVTHVV